MTRWQCRRCGATKDVRPGRPAPGRCTAASGVAGGTCGAEMARPFELACVRCDHRIQRVNTPSDPSFEIPCPRCSGRMATPG